MEAPPSRRSAAAQITTSPPALTAPGSVENVERRVHRTMAANSGTRKPCEACGSLAQRFSSASSVGQYAQSRQPPSPAMIAKCDAETPSFRWGEAADITPRVGALLCEAGKAPAHSSVGHAMLVGG